MLFRSVFPDCSSVLYGFKHIFFLQRYKKKKLFHHTDRKEKFSFWKTLTFEQKSDLSVYQTLIANKWKTCDLLINCFIFILLDEKTFLALQPHLLTISKLLQITY